MGQSVGVCQFVYAMGSKMQIQIRVRADLTPGGQGLGSQGSFQGSRIACYFLIVVKLIWATAFADVQLTIILL